MISLLAVFALGAVSSASASAADCLKVAEPGTGHWEKNTCTTPVGTTNEYVEVEKVETQLKPGEWCAKVKAGEPSRFSNNTCTTAHVGTGEFTKVMTTCYPVAVAGTGNYSSSKKCEEKVASTPAEWVMIEKMEKEIKPGEWCAKVKAGEPSRFSNNTCTTAHVGTGEFTKVKVSVDEWEVCKKEGTEEYTTNQCATKAAGGKFSWEVLGAGVTENITSKKVPGSGPEVLTAGGKVVSCTEVTNKGTITGGKPGTDLASTITFTGCTTKQPGCLVKSAGQSNGTIVLSNIPTKLEQRPVGEEEILVDNFEQNATTKEFVTLKFEGTCSEYPETKVKGNVGAEVINLSNGEVELHLPSPELPGDTLEAFGVRALFESRDEVSLESGAALRAR
jgi:hypothetical protein